MTATLSLELKGGLGNQLFHWALTEVVVSAGVSRENITWDIRRLERPGNPGYQLDWLAEPGTPIQRLSTLKRSTWAGLSRISPRATQSLAARRSSRYPPSMIRATTWKAVLAHLNTSAHLRVEGYFQDSLELLPHCEILSERLLPRLGFATSAERLPLRLPRDYTVVHIRRGDYVSRPQNLRVFGVCTTSYYKNALALLPLDLPTYICTDDPDWCESLPLDALGHRPTVFSPNTSPLADLALMANATQLVLSNSTFSWWAAFLGNPSTVVAPTPWLDSPPSDFALIPYSHWITLDKQSGKAQPASNAMRTN